MPSHQFTSILGHLVCNTVSMGLDSQTDFISDSSRIAEPMWYCTLIHNSVKLKKKLNTLTYLTIDVALCQTVVMH